MSKYLAEMSAEELIGFLKSNSFSDDAQITLAKAWRTALTKGDANGGGDGLDDLADDGDGAQKALEKDAVDPQPTSGLAGGAMMNKKKAKKAAEGADDMEPDGDSDDG